MAGSTLAERIEDDLITTGIAQLTHQDSSNRLNGVKILDAYGVERIGEVLRKWDAVDRKWRVEPLCAALEIRKPTCADTLRQFFAELETHARSSRCAKHFRTMKAQVRANAAYALGTIGDKRAMVALCAALRDIDGKVRGAASSALWRLPMQMR